MDKRQIRHIPTWKLALKFGGLFLVVVLMIEVMVGFFKSGDFTFIQKNIDNDKWIPYLTSRVIIGLIYGFTMAYLTKKQAKK